MRELSSSHWVRATPPNPDVTGGLPGRTAPPNGPRALRTMNLLISSSPVQITATVGRHFML